MSEFETEKVADSKNKVESSDSFKDPSKESAKFLSIQDELCAKLDDLKFHAPIFYVYNPLKYAKDVQETFVKKYFENSSKRILFLGMNPGPWGMCQTGICFGVPNYVKEWMGIKGVVGKPEKEHPKKKVTGFHCHRNEISGKKFWELFKELCGSPENFFRHSFVYNICPLAFLGETGKNITPPEIKDAATRKLLRDICNETFIKIIKEFQFEIIIAIGKYVEKVAIEALKNNGVINVEVIYIPHPSPRNAKNNKNWEEVTKAKLESCKLLKYFQS